MFIAKKTNAPADAATLLNSRRVPARLHSSEVAGMLGFQDHDIPVLVVARIPSFYRVMGGFFASNGHLSPKMDTWYPLWCPFGVRYL
jgi:hypothetical protein